MCGLESFFLGVMRKRDKLEREQEQKQEVKRGGTRFELFVI